MSPSPHRSRHVALLRGINVGGHGRLPMTELRQMLEELGAREVATYIQSGNAVFTATPAIAKKLPLRLSEAIAEQHGFQPEVLLRTQAEVLAACEHPFEGLDLDPKFLHVVFLASPPTEDRIAALDPDRSLPEKIEIRGREVYVAFVNGAARSRLVLDRLGVPWTSRNLRTVRRLAELITQ